MSGKIFGKIYVEDFDNRESEMFIVGGLIMNFKMYGISLNRLGIFI